MKKYILSLVLAPLTLLCSCNQTLEDASPAENNPLNQRKGNLTIEVESPSTSLTKVNLQDELITHLTVFVFNQDGSIDAAQEIENQKELTLKTSLGLHKKVYAFANWQPNSPVAKESDLLHLITQLMENTEEKGSVMCGRLTDVEITQDKSIKLPVNRSLSKISLKKIENKLTDLYLSRQTFEVKQIYLTNAALSFPLFPEEWKKSHSNNDYISDTWCNQMKWVTDTKTDSFTYKTIGATIGHNDNYSPQNPIALYTYPNLCQETTRGGSWSARQTRLVVEVQIGSETYYYSHTFPKVEPNNHYIINNFTVTRKGSDDPEQPAPDDAASFSLTIIPWFTNDLGDIII